MLFVYFHHFIFVIFVFFEPSHNLLTDSKAVFPTQQDAICIMPEKCFVGILTCTNVKVKGDFWQTCDSLFLSLSVSWH